MDVCLVQNRMNTFSEDRYYLNVNIMVIFDHHSNIIAAAIMLLWWSKITMELETLLSIKNKW